MNFNFTASSSLFYPSNHLLLALFNISSTNYNHSLLNRYFVVRTLSLALNLSESLLTIHKINGSMVKVYFSCDLYLSSNLTYQLNTLIDHYYSRRLQLLPLFTLPLIEISIVRVQKQSTTPTTSSTIVPLIEVKKAEVTLRTRLLTDNSLQHNRTVTSLSNLLVLKQFYQPLVLVPLAIIAIGLFLCAVIACCLCCNRRPSSSSTLLLPTGETSSSGSKHFYRNYPYRKHRQQYDLSKKKFHQNHHHDQRQFISKGTSFAFDQQH